MANSIKLDESAFRKMVEGIVKDILSESFENDELARVVREHGGTDRHFAAYDVRRNSISHDLRKMKVKEVIGPEMRDVIMKMDWSTPLNEQLLLLTDGSIVLLEEGEMFERGYEKKVNDRTNNFLQDHEWEKNPYTKAKKGDSNLRGMTHMNADRAAKKAKAEASERRLD